MSKPFRSQNAGGFNHQPLTINLQPSTFNHEPSTINHQPSTINNTTINY
jgi:hypothetical protein